MRPVLQGAKHIVLGAFREKWGELTSDELSMVEGQQQRLQGILKTREAQSKIARLPNPLSRKNRAQTNPAPTQTVPRLPN